MKAPATTHAATCKYRLAAEGPVGISCEHGFDVCPACDPCTCDVGMATYGWTEEQKRKAVTREVPHAP